MKKLIFSFFTLLFLVFSAQAQDDPGKAFKKAGNAFSAYGLDAPANLDKLHEAVDFIAIAESSDDLKGGSKFWQLKGDIYNAIASQISNIREIKLGSLDDLPKVENPALTASSAYIKALELAEKKYHTKDALKQIHAVQTNLNNMGIYGFEDGRFGDAYTNFSGVLEVHQVLVDAGEQSMLENDAAVNDLMYFAGLAAINDNDLEAAAPIFQKLRTSGTDKPAIYESLYKIEAADAFDGETSLTEEEQTDLLKKSYTILAEGREKFPDDISLLFAEINHFLRINELDVLISKLEMAIEKEPDNISLYSTMGNVYDNLFQNAAKDGEAEAANTYFDKSLDFYNQALAKDPDFTDATYSIGALYFNRAAAMTADLSKLADDFSKDGQAKYDALQIEIKGEFELALPYFVEVEKKKPMDINTLLALKEIYARKSDFTLSNEFKGRLEKIKNEETLESYFLNN